MQANQSFVNTRVAKDVEERGYTGFSEGDTIFYGHLNAKAYGLVEPDPTSKNITTKTIPRS